MKIGGGEPARMASAGCAVQDKIQLLGGKWPSIGVVTAYNDMLSAHAPYERFPDVIRKAAREAGAVAQVAGGVPAMCDGVTQGFEGMELSLFSRDAIALAHGGVAVARDVRFAALLLGHLRQDRAGPADWRAALSVVAGDFGARLGRCRQACRTRRRQRGVSSFAEGKIGREELLKAEAESYHSRRARVRSTARPIPIR